MPIDWDALVLAPLHTAFGETISYQSSRTGLGLFFTLTDAVFDRGYVQVGTDAGGVPVTAWSTFVGIRLASCPAGFTPLDGDRITARGAIWQIVDEQPDGKGNIMLVLASVPQ